MISFVWDDWISLRMGIIVSTIFLTSSFSWSIMASYRSVDSEFNSFMTWLT